LVFGAFGLEDGGVGTSGGELGSEGDTGCGVCGAQPTVIAQRAIAAKVDSVKFIFALLYEGWLVGVDSRVSGDRLNFLQDLASISATLGLAGIVMFFDWARAFSFSLVAERSLTICAPKSFTLELWAFCEMLHIVSCNRTWILECQTALLETSRIAKIPRLLVGQL
jgi:hypothetical protein